MQKKHYEEDIEKANIFKALLWFVKTEASDVITVVYHKLAPKKDSKLCKEIENLIKQYHNDNFLNEPMSDIEKLMYLACHNKNISSIFSILENEMRPYIDRYPEHLPAIIEIQKTFNLTDYDCKFINYLFYLKLYISTNPYHSSIPRNNMALAAAIGITEEKFAEITSTSGLYRLSSIIDFNQGDRIFSLKQSINSYIWSKGKVSILEYFSKKDVSDKFYEISSFAIDKNIVDTARKLIKDVPNAKILLHGPSGTGKTEFARSLIISSGKKVRFSMNSSDVFITLMCCGEKEVTIVDEADNILNENIKGADDKKSNLNIKLDELNKQCIFISNKFVTIDGSVLRRFDLIISFHEPDKFTRYSQYRENIVELKQFMDDTAIKNFAMETKLPIGIVAKCAKSATRNECSKEDSRRYFNCMIKSHSIARYGESQVTKSSDNFQIDFINSSINPQQIIDYAMKYTQANKSGVEGGFSLLLHGQPGTGKTEFARYLAKTFEIESRIVKSSDILNMYVGGTERNIARTFSDAKRGQCMLIFDEVDSMLYARQDATKSWEVSFVNEFLAQMDDFNGVLACTTNFIESLDSACIRRFDWKVELLPMTEIQIDKMIAASFPNMEIVKGTGAQLKGLTPSDIATVAKHSKFKNKIAYKDIVSELKLELAYKKALAKKSIGF